MLQKCYNIKSMFDKFLHKNLRVPYRLNFETLRKVENPRAVVVFLHGIASNREIWRTASGLIDGNINIYAVDLLGHGNSPKPNWRGAQSLEVQARALGRTMIHFKKMKKPVFLVGHSMGSLISAEFAQKYPRLADKIFLISPPIYSKEEAESGLQEKILQKGYEAIIKNPEKSIDFINGVIQTGAVKVEKFENQEQFRPIRRALKEAIIQQNTFETLSKIQTPTQIFYGAFDPVVIGRNIRKLGRINPQISTSRVLASHDPTAEIIKRISKTINNSTKEENV